MRMSVLPSFSEIPRTIETTWGDFVASIREHVISADKRSVPLYSPASYPPGSPRKSEYVESLAFGSMDYDHLSYESARALLGHLQTLPFRWAVYSTFSHGEKGESSYRVLFPFLSPVPGREWDRVFPQLAELLTSPEGLARPDAQCSDAARAFYVPTAHPERAHLATFYERTDLPPLDLSALRIAAHASGLRSLPAAIVPGTRKVSRGSLEAFASRLKRKKVPTGEALQKVLDGLPWAEPGNRDNLLYQIAGDLATEFPDADMREIVAFFALSVDRMNDPEYSLDAILGKLLRRQGEIQAENARKEADREIERESRIRSAFRELGEERGEPYTDTEIEQFATVAGLSRSEFQKRWIILNGGAFYFYFQGGYVGPIKESDASLAARKYLAPAPCELDRKDAFGRVSARTMGELSADYGTHARRVIADMNSDLSVFDARTSTLIEAPCPLRRISARFSLDVDTWLKHLAGDRYETLCDWLSWVTDLDRPCTALFLQGAPGAGKSMLANGLARLWTDGPPTTLEQAFSNFNAGMLRCPLVFADERVPKDTRGNARTEDIRAFIQERERPLRRKFCDDAVMKGATRLVIAANNRDVLQTREAHLTVHDIQAIADRICMIPVSEDAARYLASLGSLSLSDWVQGDRVAAHVLWLVENRPKNPNPPRFLVQGGTSNLHIDIAFGTSIGSAVAHWLCAFLDDPSRLWAGKTPRSSAFGITYSADPHPRYTAGLVVSAQTIADHWNVYKTNVREDKATLRAVGLSLQSFSEGRTTWTFPDGTKRQCNRVPLTNLIAWGEENGIHPETIAENALRLVGMLNARTGAK